MAAAASAVRSHAWLEPTFFAVLCLPAAYLWSCIQSATLRSQVSHAALFGAVAFASVYYLIPALAPRFLGRNLKGKDMGRRGTKDEHVEMCVTGAARPFFPPFSFYLLPLAHPPNRSSPRAARRAWGLSAPSCFCSASLSRSCG